MEQGNPPPAPRFAPGMAGVYDDTCHVSALIQAFEVELTPARLIDALEALSIQVKRAVAEDWPVPR